MKEPKNPNYCATVVKIETLRELDGCDNVVATQFFGNQAIVGKDTQLGEVGIVFPAETQLSDEFCRANNLYRHKELNRDQTVGGYIEDNRRVRAIKFRGHRSDCIYLPLSSVYYTAYYGDIPEGTSFDELNHHEICRKYEVVHRGEVSQSNSMSKKVQDRVEVKYIPEMFDVENYFRNKDRIKDRDYCIVTQKLHGTSIRVANTKVKRQLGWQERLAKRLGIKIQEYDFEYVFGSRKVIKGQVKRQQNHFYEYDLWQEEGEKLRGLVPENYVVYGELIGWTRTNRPIQRDYTYQIPRGKCELYIYRVAVVNDRGISVDLGWEQVKEFCRVRDLQTVKEIQKGIYLSEDEIKELLDRRLADDGDLDVVPTEKGFVDEGVCIRVEGLTPLILKAKSPLFLQHETKLLDKGEEDMESSGVSDG